MVDVTEVWTEERIVELRRLWDEGLTTGEIGRRIGVSKNAVIGKSHRLNLTGRPSPIKRAKIEKPEELKKFTVFDLTATSCRWPIGDPRNADFHFCGKKSLPGKSYCLDHAAVAYVRPIKSRKEDAA